MGLVPDLHLKQNVCFSSHSVYSAFMYFSCDHIFSFCVMHDVSRLEINISTCQMCLKFAAGIIQHYILPLPNILQVNSHPLMLFTGAKSNQMFVMLFHILKNNKIHLCNLKCFQITHCRHVIHCYRFLQLLVSSVSNLSC